MSNAITLSAFARLPDKTKADVIVRFLSCEMKTGKASGKTYFNCKLADHEGAFSLYGSFFGNTPAQFVNQVAVIRGAEKGEFNGKPQLSAGKFAKVEEWVADLEAAPAAPAPRSSPAPAQTRPAAQSPHQVQQMPLSGQTIGMSVKAAVDIWIATGGATESQGGFGTQQALQIERIARLLIGVSQQIERNPNAETEDVPF